MTFFIQVRGVFRVLPHPLDKAAAVRGYEAHRVVGVVDQIVAAFIRLVGISRPEAARGFEYGDLSHRVTVDQLEERTGARKATTDQRDMGRRDHVAPAPR